MRGGPTRCGDEAGRAAAEIAAAAASRQQARHDRCVATRDLGPADHAPCRDLTPGGRIAARLRRRRARRWAQAAGMARAAVSTVPTLPRSPMSPVDGAPSANEGVAGHGASRQTLRPGEFDAATLAAVLAAIEGRSSRESGGNEGVLQGPMEYGFNVCHIEAGQERDFGSSSAILADVANLGAPVIRQAGTTDLLFSQLFGDTDKGLLLMPPTSKFAQLLEEYRRDQLQPFLEGVHEAGLQVSLTLYGLGGGGSKDNMSKGADKVYGTGLIQGISGFDWSLHATESLDGFSGAAIAESAYLDIRDGYGQAYLGALADAVAAMLADVEAEFQRTDRWFRLADVVYGVELMNELDGCNIASSNDFGSLVAAVSGARWAQVTHRWAQPLWDTFLGELPVLLPGLSSHDIPADAVTDTNTKSIHTWPWKRAWFTGYVWWFQQEHEAFRGGSFSASEMCPSVDLHWYFRGITSSKEGDEKIGYRHVARLAWQVDEIRAILADQGLVGTGVTVFESGSSVLANPAGAKDEQFVPTGWTREAFQAREVFRRLVGAAASGALAGGWHSYQSVRGEGSFAGMGVREDVEGITAEEMAPRPSWYAFQRLTDILSDWMGCSMVLPTSLAVDEDSKRQVDAVVVEFLLPSGSEGTWAYGYVCFLDAWRKSGSVDVECKSSRSVTVTSFKPTPFSTVTVEPAPGGELPSAQAYYSAPATFTVGTSPTTVSLDRGDYPMILLSKERLSWSLA